MPSSKHSLHTLYLAYARELNTFVRRRVGHDESRDVVHDTYVRLVTYGEPDLLDNPRAYLYRVAANVANDYGKRAAQQEAISEADIAAAPSAQVEPSAEDRVEHRRTLMRCLAALDALPEVYRHVFLLHRVDGMPQAEIAASLGIPRRTVERYIAKALAHCLKAMEDGG